MFENFGTAIVQALGFFGVFAFFVFRLITDKNSEKIINSKSTIKAKKSKISPQKEKKGLFSRNSKVEQNSYTEIKNKKKGWFNR
tara:strand:- start:311 stop:562 length:252 start_codon:yes stop_codon:yes gene_type:complete